MALLIYASCGNIKVLLMKKYYMENNGFLLTIFFNQSCMIQDILKSNKIGYWSQNVEDQSIFGMSGEGGKIRVREGFKNKQKWLD